MRVASPLPAMVLDQISADQSTRSTAAGSAWMMCAERSGITDPRCHGEDPAQPVEPAVGRQRVEPALGPQRTPITAVADGSNRSRTQLPSATFCSGSPGATAGSGSPGE